MREFVKKWEVLITVIISITSIFFCYKSERDDISNACTGNRILTSLKIMEVIITRKKLSELA